MKSKTNPFLQNLRLVATAAAVLVSTSAHAENYSFGDNVLQPFTLTATDQARVQGAGITASGTLSPDNGAVYDRGTDQDATYMHFNLILLAGSTIDGDVNLNLPVNAQWGGDILNGIIGTATSTWTTTSAAPGITPFTPVAAPNQTYANGATATWTIGNNDITSFVADYTNFKGLGITAGNGSNAHFSALATLTGNYTAGEVRVINATDWSAASWNNGTKTLSINGTSNVTGGDVILSEGTTVSVAGSATLNSGVFTGLFSNEGTLSFDSSTNQTLSGTIFGAGSLSKSNSGVLTLTGAISYKGGTTVNGGTLELPGGDWVTGDPWSSGGANGAITIGSGATLSTSNGVTQIKNGLTMNGGTLSSRGLGYDGQWGNVYLSSNITAGGAATSTIFSQINLNGSQTITVETGSTLNISGKVISWNNDGAGITKDGAGTLSLTAANTYTGPTTVTEGTLSLSSACLSDSNALSISLDAKVNLGFTGTDAVGSLIIDGSPLPEGVYSNSTHPAYFTGTGTITVLPPANDGTWTAATNGDWSTATNWQSDLMAFGTTKTATFNGVTGVTVTVDKPISIGSLVFDTSDFTIAGSNALTVASSMNVGANRTATISAPLAAPNGIRKIGNGTLNLSGSNSYTGTTSAQGGLLSLTSGTSNLGNLYTNGGNLTIGGNALVTASSFTAQGDWNTMTIQENADVTLTNGMDLTNHSSAYRFNGGILRTSSIRGGQVVWEPGNSGLFFNGTRIVATGNNEDFITTNGWESWNVLWIQPGAGAIIDTAGYTVGIQRPFCDRDGSGKLTKKGAGTLKLHQNWTPIGIYSGGTTVEEGILELVNGAEGRAAVQGTLNLNPGTQVNLTGGDGTGFGFNPGWKVETLNINSATITAGNSHLWGTTANMTGGTLNGSFQWNLVTINTLENASMATISGAITLRAGNGFTSSSFNVEDGAAATDLLVSSTITEESTPVGIKKYGPGTMSLTGTNTYTGETTINEGTLAIATNTLADASSVAILTGGSLEIPAGATDTVDKLFLDGTQVTAGDWGGLTSSAANKTELITGSGILTVVSSPPPADPLLAWIDETWPNLSDKNATADPDNDGIPNILEYVLKGGDPSTPNGNILPKAAVSGDNFVFTFYRRITATGVTQTFQADSDLNGWETSFEVINGQNGVTIAADPADATSEIVTITVPKNGNTKWFGRLQVTQ